jgi:hypothetical protein
MRPTKKNNRHGEPRRSLEGLDCLGMKPATPANMPASCDTRRRASCRNRQHVATVFRNKESPRRGSQV